MAVVFQNPKHRGCTLYILSGCTHGIIQTGSGNYRRTGNRRSYRGSGSRRLFGHEL